MTGLIAAADRNLYANKQKAHDRSEGRTVAPQITAPQTEEAARQIKVEQAPRDDPRPPDPFASAVSRRGWRESSILLNTAPMAGGLNGFGWTEHPH